MKIHQLKLKFSNAYLLHGVRPILVDTGSPGETHVIRLRLRSLNVEFKDLAMIVHTHAHSDHMGCTAEIARESKCPIAYHEADQAIVDQATNGDLKGIGLRGAIMARVFRHAPFESVQANIFLADGMQLSEFGCDVRILATPGHTAGSVSFITAQGDAIIGDVIMGGYMGGLLLPSRPNYHYFADDLMQAMASLDSILNQTSRNLYVGHGGPISHSSVLAWRNKMSRKLMRLGNIC